MPDVSISLDVETAEDFWAKEHRVEVVSNTIGKEDEEKKRLYARMRVSYYHHSI